MQQMLDAIVLRLPNLLIEASSPGGGGDNVPQADTPTFQAVQPLPIFQLRQLFSDDFTKQAPELIGRMRIILPCGQRGIAGQASQDEKAHAREGDWWKAIFDAHKETPTAPRRASR